MKRIVLDYRHGEYVHGSIDPDTSEVAFDDKVVTGKMWLVLPGVYYVEIFERDGKYYLEPAA